MLPSKLFWWTILISIEEQSWAWTGDKQLHRILPPSSTMKPTFFTAFGAFFLRQCFSVAYYYLLSCSAAYAILTVVSEGKMASLMWLNISRRNWQMTSGFTQTVLRMRMKSCKSRLYVLLLDYGEFTIYK